MELGTVIPAETSLIATGLDSIAATELTRTVSGRFNIELPSTLLFDHPTTSAVVRFIAGALEVASSMLVDGAVVSESISPSRGYVIPISSSSKMPPRSLVALGQGFSIMAPGPYYFKAGLKELAILGLAACETVPAFRWDATSARHVQASAAYGAFFANGASSTDTPAFGISSLES